jgi:hypothetical protein
MKIVVTKEHIARELRTARDQLAQQDCRVPALAL